jgi:hypothetical protein
VVMMFLNPIDALRLADVLSLEFESASEKCAGRRASAVVGLTD